jgi:ribosomal protein L16 Arg81 hydroxylase
MSWEMLNEILSMERVWSASSLKLVLDKEMVPAEAYCRPTQNRNGESVMAPARDMVTEWGRRGASLVLNNVEDLVGALATARVAIEQAMRARGMINLYCSWRGRQAFDTHFDPHDVFALQIAGEKLWRIYANRFDNPIEHAAFKSFPQSFFDDNRGDLVEEIRLRPGDLLYLPRGTYHDALAASDASIHLSCGMIEPIGLSWLTAMWELAVLDPLFRASLPRLDTPADELRFRAHAAKLLDRLREIATSERGVARAHALSQAPTRPARYDLPIAGSLAALRYEVRAKNLKVLRRGADWIVSDGGAPRRVAEAEAKILSWIVARPAFTRDEFGAAFADRPALEREQALAGLAAGRVIEAV